MTHALSKDGQHASAAMERDYRRLLTPEQLYSAGLRISGSYTIDDAVRDYLRIHPDGNVEEVRGEIEKATATTA